MRGRLRRQHPGSFHGGLPPASLFRGASNRVGNDGRARLFKPGARPGRVLKKGRRDAANATSVQDLALSLRARAWRTITWREGTNDWLSSRFARVRVHVASSHERPGKPSKEWLLIEWPECEDAPTKYWLSTLPSNITFRDLVDAAKLRWRIERDYEELKQEVGLGHYEGRGWRGFHHHGTMCIAAYGFLISERETIPPVKTSLRRAVPVIYATRWLPTQRLRPCVPNGAAPTDHVRQATGIQTSAAPPSTTSSTGPGEHWLKTKCVQAQELVILGYVPSTAGAGFVGSLEHAARLALASRQPLAVAVHACRTRPGSSSSRPTRSPKLSSI